MPSPDRIADLDTLERSRRHMLQAVVIATVAWMLPQILQSVLGESIPQRVTATLIVVGLLGSVAWIVLMWRLHRVQQRVLQSPPLRARLNDERIVELRREAVYRSWWVLVLVLGFLTAVVPFVDLPDTAVVLSLLLVAVNAPIAFFLAMDRD